MFTALLFILVACDNSPQQPPPEPAVEAKPPKDKKPIRKKRPKSGSQAAADTGTAANLEIIRSVRYTPSKPNPFENLSIEVDVDRQGVFVDVDVEWYVNGRKIISQRFETLPYKYFEKDDLVQAVVTVSRGDAEQTLEAREIKVGNTDRSTYRLQI